MYLNLNLLIRHLDDEQRGHSTNTAERNYGLTHDMLESVDGSRVLGCLLASADWHSILGVGQDDVLPVVGEASEVRHTAEHQPNISVSNPLSTADLQKVAAVISENLEPRVQTVLHNIIAQLAAHHFPPPPNPPPMAGPQQRSTVAVHPSRLADLRRFLKDPNARFTYPEQAELLELMQARESNLLAVLPCAGGKTFMLMLQVRLECSGSNLQSSCSCRPRYTRVN